MRVTIEQTAAENNQKTVIECEKDDVNLEDAMSMLLRALVGHGYDKQAVGAHFIELAEYYYKHRKDTEEPEESEEE